MYHPGARPMWCSRAKRATLP
ncbi:MAG: hypothetical protein IID07_03995 [Gemmatimonadetes bacterium]|nr:hypothetical protein [Gemmatimonadota bacterium]